MTNDPVWQSCLSQINFVGRQSNGERIHVHGIVADGVDHRVMAVMTRLDDS